ncbi:MAG: FecR domain-containing protein [Spirochaetales bacterium]|nr:FecR domain-containing protein [Spirochaetales bacterium]
MLIPFQVFASDSAVIKEITGRVEIMNPGEDWQPATVGTLLPKGASISTGFGSTAILEVGAAKIEVASLSRMSLDELVQIGGRQTTSLEVRVGKVKAEVNRDEGLSHDFKLRSPSATAAVRGTKFSFGGNRLEVTKGTVAFGNQHSTKPQLVNKGESSTVSSTSGKTSAPLSEMVKSTSTKASTAKEQSTDAQSSAATNSASSASPVSSIGASSGNTSFYGNIVITVSE